MTTEASWPAEREAIAAAIQTAAPERRPESLLTGWVVIAEWMDGDGEKWLTRYVSEEMTAWQRDGMLEHGQYDEAWEVDGPEDE